MNYIVLEERKERLYIRQKTMVELNFHESAKLFLNWQYNLCL